MQATPSNPKHLPAHVINGVEAMWKKRVQELALTKLQQRKQQPDFFAGAFAGILCSGSQEIQFPARWIVTVWSDRLMTELEPLL